MCSRQRWASASFWRRSSSSPDSTVPVGSTPSTPRVTRSFAEDHPRTTRGPPEDHSRTTGHCLASSAAGRSCPLTARGVDHTGQSSSLLPLPPLAIYHSTYFQHPSSFDRPDFPPSSHLCRHSVGAGPFILYSLVKRSRDPYAVLCYNHPLHCACVTLFASLLYFRSVTACPLPSFIPAKVMYHREHTPRPRKAIIRMDPDCAICHAPATLACDCEAKGLELAIRQAEARMMQSVYNDIRSAHIPCLAVAECRATASFC